MANPVVESYENYREEDRLTTNNARRIESGRINSRRRLRLHTRNGSRIDSRQ